MTDQTTQTLSQIFDSRTSRLAVIEFLALHPGTKVAEMSEELDLSPATIRNQLQNLIGVGIVVNDADPYFPMQGQRPRYWLNRKELLAALNDFAAKLQAVVIDSAEDLPATQRLSLTWQDLKKLLDNDQRSG